MSGIFEAVDFPVNFSGIARLFPLPNLVMFPHVLQPLRVFEPRYCEMLEDALVDDQLIAMTLLQPGWEKQYYGCPAISTTICLGRVISHSRNDDGEHTILLLGMRRASIKRELRSSRAYRTAEVSVLDDYYPSSSAAERPWLHREILDCFKELLPESSIPSKQLMELANANIPLGILADIISFTMDIDLPIKQTLLTERNVDLRASVLFEYLRHRLDGRVDQQPFPPSFSSN